VRGIGRNRRTLFRSLYSPQRGITDGAASTAAMSPLH